MNEEITNVEEENNLIEVSKDMLEETRKSIDSNKTIKIPVAKLASLGNYLSSLMPKITKTTTDLSTDGLFKIVNASKGDTLKIAKNGNAWGA